MFLCKWIAQVFIFFRKFLKKYQLLNFIRHMHIAFDFGYFENPVCCHINSFSLFSLEKVLVKFSNTHLVKGYISQWYSACLLIFTLWLTFLLSTCSRFYKHCCNYLLNCKESYLLIHLALNYRNLIKSWWYTFKALSHISIDEMNISIFSGRMCL